MVTIQSDPVPLHVDQTGTIRVAGTRITVDVLLGYLLGGVTPEEIVSETWYPMLTLADVHGVLAYYYRHRDDVDDYLKRRRDQATGMQKEVEGAMPNFAETKARLLARRNATHAPSAD